MERLTKWEDGNITYKQKREFECGEYCDSCSQGAGNCKTVENMIKKLAAYEDLEEQGLLIKLPCKIGDTVFIIVGKDISKQTIREMEISDDGLIKFKTKRRTFSTTWFGIDVFTTYKEAEMELRNRWRD